MRSHKAPLLVAEAMIDVDKLTSGNNAFDRETMRPAVDTIPIGSRGTPARHSIGNRFTSVGLLNSWLTPLKLVVVR